MGPIRRAAVTLFGLALAAGLLPATGPSPAHAAGLTSFSPTGEAGLVREVRAVFSEPMTRLGDSGAPDPFLIDCPVKGDSRWVDNRTWVHVFRTPPRAGTRCGFSLRPQLRTLGGEALAGRSRHEFSTGGPVVARSMPWEGSRIDEDQSFLLVLTGPVDPDTAARKAWCRVAGMGERAENRQLVRAMINLAHNLHLEVVAEGVENAEQLALLRQFGCDQVQGYLISKPLPLAELARFLVFGLRQPLLGGLPS